MNRLLRIVRNKYLIAGAIFGVWMLFFDRHDITAQHSYYSQLKELQAQQAFYVQEIDRIGKGIADIHSKPSEVERIAREKYHMKKDNEDIFVIFESEGDTKK